MSKPTEETITDLVVAVESLVGEIQVFTRAIDDLRDEITWAVRNGRLGSPRPITSMPIDPAASDWAADLNQFTADDVEALDAPAEPLAGRQGQLW